MVKTIAHLADIHIRKLHRFVEYREVFKRLYKKLEYHKPDLIYIGGDIVHGKLDTSPEEIRMVANFFLSLCKISPTIVIPGNHDCNLNNKSREDTLSPIIDLVKKIDPNIHYWKKTGVYTIDDVDFGVLSIFDIDKDGNQRTDTLPNPKEMKNTKIGLFHGAVGTFQYDNGFQVTDDIVSNDTFKGYDLVLLGDIHKRQFLNKKETIGYCGSLIQQGFAEDPAHGFLLWDIEEKTSRFVQVENDYGFKVINVENGVIQNKMKFMPPKGKVKIKYWNTTLEQIKDIQIDLRKKYPKIKEVIAEKQDAFSKIKGVSNKINIGDVRDVTYQNELITDFLSNNVEGVDTETIKRVCELNKMTNNSPEIDDGDIARNIDWKIKSCKFDNMFCYGDNNKLDFTNINGVAGIVAPNHSGKSAVMDAISYTIFDKCSRTSKAIEVVNTKKMSFKSSVNLEINGEDYFIERSGVVNRRKSRSTGDVTYTCPVKPKFYMIDGDDEIDLSGAARSNSQYGSGTNEEIRKMLGTFDDFILTSLSLQSNGMDFVDKPQNERKKILSKFMDIDIFDQLYDIAKTDSADERSLLRAFNNKDLYSELANIESKIVLYTGDEEKFSNEELDLSDKILKFNNKKLNLVKKLQDVDSSIDTDINYLDKKREDLINKKLDMEKTLDIDIDYKENLRPLYNKYNIKLNQLDENKIQEDYETFNKLKSELKDIENSLKLNESKTKALLKHKDDLDKFKYDENCEFCIKNGEEQINEMNEIKHQLGQLDGEYQFLEQELHKKTELLEVVNNAETQKDEYDRFSDELNRIQNDAIKVSGKIESFKSKIKTINAESFNIDNKISQYYDNENKIKNNKKINGEILDIESEINKLEINKDEISDKYKNALTNLHVYTNEKDGIERDIKKVVDIEQKIQDYNLYLECLSKDGIPSNLISKTIPAIEKEINYVLENMMAGFYIELEMENKNINAYICYGDEKWNLELSSGMERFVSSLAIRIGLINVSTLPRPNFIVIDEGFGTLDSDNIANMESAFNYLKTQFDFVLIITHLDIIKDYMDHLISIEKKGDFSYINF